MKHIKTYEIIQSSDYDDLRLKISQNDLKKFFVCENSEAITIFKYNGIARSPQKENQLDVHRLYVYGRKGDIEKQNDHFICHFKPAFKKFVIYTSDDLKDCLNFVNTITNITKYNL